jgi:hypothetical protein
MLIKKISLLIFGLLAFSEITFSQKQLVLIKRGNVIARFAEGQYFRCVLKKSHRKTEGHIIELSDFSMITSSDTIKFQDILKIDIHKHRAFRWNSGVGGLLFIGGLGYLGLDRLNSSIGIGSSSLDNSVLYTSLIASGVGAAVIFIRPRYQHVHMDYFLHTIDYTSPFYLH